MLSKFAVERPKISRPLDTFGLTPTDLCAGRLIKNAAFGVGFILLVSWHG
jgi:hypothetical protein